MKEEYKNGEKISINKQPLPYLDKLNNDVKNITGNILEKRKKYLLNKQQIKEYKELSNAGWSDDDIQVHQEAVAFIESEITVEDIENSEWADFLKPLDKDK